MEHDLLALYTAAFAPLGGNTIITEIGSITPDDVTPETLAAETRYVSNLSECGMKLFTDYFNSAPANRSPSEGGPELTEKNDDAKKLSAALHCYDAFLRRISKLNEALTEMSRMLYTEGIDCRDLIELIERAVKEDNVRPTQPEALGTLLDLSANAKWEKAALPGLRRKVESVSGSGQCQGRVGFHEVTTVITDGDNGQAQEALKNKFESRRRARNPTGFAKFTFRASDFGMSEVDISAGDETQSQNYPMSTSASSYAGRDSRASSVVDIIDSDPTNAQEIYNPFRRVCGERSNSLVGFPYSSEREEIQDEDADPMWSVDDARRSRRQHRIRARKATGSPALMKETSLELRDMLDGVELASTEDLEALTEATLTAVNTTRNTRNQSITQLD